MGNKDIIGVGLEKDGLPFCPGIWLCVLQGLEVKWYLKKKKWTVCRGEFHK